MNRLHPKPRYELLIFGIISIVYGVLYIVQIVTNKPHSYHSFLLNPQGLISGFALSTLLFAIFELITELLHSYFDIILNKSRWWFLVAAIFVPVVLPEISSFSGFGSGNDVLLFFSFGIAIINAFLRSKTKK